MLRSGLWRGQCITDSVWLCHFLLRCTFSTLAVYLGSQAKMQPQTMTKPLYLPPNLLHTDSWWFEPNISNFEMRNFMKDSIKLLLLISNPINKRKHSSKKWCSIRTGLKKSERASKIQGKNKKLWPEAVQRMNKSMLKMQRQISCIPGVSRDNPQNKCCKTCSLPLNLLFKCWLAIKYFYPWSQT